MKLMRVLLLTFLVLTSSCSETNVLTKSLSTNPKAQSSISALSVSSSAETYKTDKSPKVLILGNFVAGDTVNLFSDLACSDLIGSKIISLQESIQNWINISPTSPLDAGIYNFSSSISGNETCKNVGVTFTIEDESPIISALKLKKSSKLLLQK